MKRFTWAQVERQLSEEQPVAASASEIKRANARHPDIQNLGIFSRTIHEPMR
ncbi:MAG: hypothetical protein AAGA34_09680 [Pseudomonadota bacterium]